MNPFRSTRLTKLAFGLDYFAQRQMSPGDMSQVDSLLDEQGIPRRTPPPVAAPAPSSNPFTTLVTSLRGQPAAGAPPSFMDRAADFGRRNKRNLVLGGGAVVAVGLGAAFMRRRANEAQITEPEMPNQQGGF